MVAQMQWRPIKRSRRYRTVICERRAVGRRSRSGDANADTSEEGGEDDGADAADDDDDDDDATAAAAAVVVVVVVVVGRRRDACA